MNHGKTTVTAILSGLLTAGAIEAQAPVAEPLRFAVESALIEVEVNVTGPHGEHVLDLGRDDFVVLEEGKPQRLVHVVLRTAASPGPLHPSALHPSAPPAAPARVPLERRPRLVVLAVDDLHLAPDNLLATRRALLRFLDERLPDGDLAALVALSGSGGLLHSFTADRAGLRKAVERIAPRDRAVSSLRDRPRIGLYQADLIERGDRMARTAAVVDLLQEDAGMLPVVAEQIVEAKARSLVRDAQASTRLALDTMRAHIRALRRLEGGKTVILFSDGFLVGRDYGGDLQEIAGLAARAGIVFYTIDMRGLDSRPPGGDASRGGRDPTFEQERYRRLEFEGLRDGLNALARDTGGLPLFNLAEPATGLDRVLEDTAVAYRLAYEPSVPPRDGRFHKIEVRIPRRSGLNVRTFRGYMADAPAKAAARSAVDRLQQALVSLAPPRDLNVELTAGWLDTPEGPAAVIATRIEPPAPGGASERGEGAQPVKIKGIIFDASGQPVAHFDDSREMTVDPTKADPAITFTTRSLLKPGAHHIRVAALAGERLGGATASVEIPDLTKGGLAVSDLFVALDEQSLPLPIPAGRRFRRTQDLEFVLYASGARPSSTAQVDLGIRVRMLSGAETVGESPFEIVIGPGEPAPKQVPFSRHLPLADFAPGDYTLSVLVTDRVSQATAERSLRFVVVD